MRVRLFKVVSLMEREMLVSRGLPDFVNDVIKFLIPEFMFINFGFLHFGSSHSFHIQVF